MTLNDILNEVGSILHGKDVFQFSHPSFREVLAAQYFYNCIAEKNALALSVKISKKVLEFIADMNPPAGPLYDFIHSTRNMTAKECGFLGGNSATLLGMIGEDLRGKDFSNTNLREADLSDLNLEGMILKGAVIENASFDYSNLCGVDMRDIKNPRASFLEGPLDPMFFEGESIYVVNPLGSLIEWNFEHGEVRRIRTAADPNIPIKRQLNWAREWLVELIDGIPTVYDLKSGKKTFIDGISNLKEVSELAFSYDGDYLAAAQYFEELFYSKVTLTDLRGRREKFELVLKEPSHSEPGVFNYGKVSNLNFCFRYFACDTYSGRGDESVLASTQVFERVPYGGWEHLWELNSNQDREEFRSRSVFSPNSNHIAAHEVIYSLKDDSHINLRDEMRRLSMVEYSSSGLFELPFYSLKPHFFSFDNRYLVMSGYPDEGQTRIVSYDMKTNKMSDLYCTKYRPGPGDLMHSLDGERVAFTGVKRNSADIVIAVCSIDFKRNQLVPLYELSGASLRKPIFEV